MAEERGLKELRKLGAFLGEKFNKVVELIEALRAAGLTADEIRTLVTTSLNDGKAYTDQKIAALVGSAPETLDTIQEIAAAFKNNADIIDVLHRAIAGKSDLNHIHSDATSETSGFMSAADKVKLDNVGSYDEMVEAFNTTVGEGSAFYVAPAPKV